MAKSKPQSNNYLDYKKQKQDARRNKSETSSHSSTNEPYYKKKNSKKTSKLDTMDEDQETWARGKLKNGSLFSDSECDTAENNDSNSDSDEKPVPVAIVNKQKKASKKEKEPPKKPVLPIDSSSDSESNKKKKKKTKKSRKDVFSDSGESSSESDDSDSSTEAPKAPIAAPSFMESMSKWVSEPGCVTKAKALLTTIVKDRGSSNISLAFKGGKESAVMLHLMKTVLDDMNQGYDILDVVYFAPVNNEIKKVNEYIHAFVKSMKMGKCLKVIETEDLTEGLQKYVHSTNISTMVIGIKSSDEGAKKLQPTMQTQDVVQLNRIHPLLTWTYKDVWDYINTNNVDVCELYKSGYTKLNTSDTTTRNPTLSDKKSNTYQSAENLKDVTKEEWSNFTCIEGKVLKGGQRGRILMGVPTARVDAIPYGFEDGIYIGKARVNEVDKKYRKAIISISSRIDISGKHKRTVAVYISHKYSSDFYGKYMSVHIIGLLRKQQQYENELQLRNAMDVDIKYLDSILVDKDMKV